MSRAEILKRVSEVFQDVFAWDDLEVSEDLMVGKIEGWDSLRHMRLIASIESEFRVDFSLEEIGEIRSVKGIVDLLEKRV